MVHNGFPFPFLSPFFLLSLLFYPIIPKERLFLSTNRPHGSIKSSKDTRSSADTNHILRHTPSIEALIQSPILSNSHTVNAGENRTATVAMMAIHRYTLAKKEIQFKYRSMMSTDIRRLMVRLKYREIFPPQQCLRSSTDCSLLDLHPAKWGDGGETRLTCTCYCLCSLRAKRARATRFYV